MEKKEIKKEEKQINLTAEEIKNVTGGNFPEVPRVAESDYSQDKEESDITDRI